LLLLNKSITLWYRCHAVLKVAFPIRSLQRLASSYIYIYRERERERLLTTSRYINQSCDISKIFEHAFYIVLANTSFHQTINLVLRKLLDACMLYIYTVRSVVDRYISNGSTVNLCALELGSCIFYMIR